MKKKLLAFALALTMCLGSGMTANAAMIVKNNMSALNTLNTINKNTSSETSLHKEIMKKYENIHAIVNEIGTIVFRYKNKDITQDDECQQILAELQQVCDKYRIKVGEQEGKLARDISALFLEYLCKED